jgi:hypothetical protein
MAENMLGRRNSPLLEMQIVVVSSIILMQRLTMKIAARGADKEDRSAAA